ncbi:MAG: gamma-glutamyl-gamma-aminobutyrate hydrolase family protein [Bacteroidetes bacterium]|nr:gamma-glutamyl-gamma-aminobutyrate hydrolase family protein [Bacteroidota bacterium]
MIYQLILNVFRDYSLRRPCIGPRFECARDSYHGISGKYPVLGICYGAQLMAQQAGGNVMPSKTREYGRAHLSTTNGTPSLLKNVSASSQVWMSHGDTITEIPEGFEIIASTETVKVAAYKVHGEQTFGVQFHPEVVHSTEGKTLLSNFLFDVCGFTGDWTPGSYIEETVAQLKQQLGNDKVILGLSGGVDSGVAVLLHRAIGKNLYCISSTTDCFVKMNSSRCLMLINTWDCRLKVWMHPLIFIANWPVYQNRNKNVKLSGVFFIEFDRRAHAIEDVEMVGAGYYLSRYN